MQKVLPSLLAFPSNTHWTQYEAKALAASASSPSLGPQATGYTHTLTKLNSSPVHNSNMNNNMLGTCLQNASDLSPKNFPVCTNGTSEAFVGTSRKSPLAQETVHTSNVSSSHKDQSSHCLSPTMKFGGTVFNGAMSLLSFDSETQPARHKSMTSIRQLEELQQREAQLLSKIKIAMQGRAGEQYVTKLSNELQSIFNQKQESLATFCSPDMEFPRESEPMSEHSFGNILSIVQQPAEVAVANRYLIPAPGILVTMPQNVYNDSAFLVSVSLCYHGAENEVKTLDGKQEVLQGIRKVSVDRTGYVTFSKLKVTEVSSKHRHQSFCLLFALEEYSSTNGSRVIARIRSKPFHVQSRPNKRKRSVGDDNGELQPPEKKLTSTDMSLVEHTRSVTSPDRHTSETAMSVMEMCNSDVSRSNVMNIESSSDEASDSESSQSIENALQTSVSVSRSMSFSESLSSSSFLPIASPSSQSPSSQSPNSSPSMSPLASPKSPFPLSNLTSPSRESEFDSSLTGSRKLTRRESSSNSLTSLEESETVSVTHANDSNYIDITSLLILPQKEAARRLGISESMLCKRFKECTRRKWPYRYLRKIDKIIGMLNLHQKSDGIIAKEDRDKLARLVKERETCLRPVKIRISSYDTMATEEQSNNIINNNTSTTTAVSTSTVDDSSVEEDIPDHILETLEMLKMQRPMTESTPPKYHSTVSSSLAPILC